MVERVLLVLDLDETLLYASEHPLERPSDFQIGPYFVYLRPHLSSFLEFTFSFFEVGVWTSSSPDYAKAVCSKIFLKDFFPCFVWASDRCSLRRDVEEDAWLSINNLKKIKRKGYDLKRVLMVDDSPEKHTKNYGNLILVAPYLGEVEDHELAYLKSYLPELLEVSDVRGIEKRMWREKVNKSTLLWG